MEPLDTEFTRLVRMYTDVATTRSIDALGIARAAMTAPRLSRVSAARLGAGLLSQRIGAPGVTIATVAIVLVGVVAVGIQQQISDTARGPIPDALRHTWERPYAVGPGEKTWPSGYLRLTSEPLEYGRASDAGGSRSEVAAEGTDTLVLTATLQTIGCRTGDIGIYRWIVEGKGTVLTLTPIGTDRCSARESRLAGPWVRSDFPPRTGEGFAALLPGTHLTSSFDPFGEAATPGQLTYTVTEGWQLVEDGSAVFVLHRAPMMIAVLAEPRMTAEYETGARCGTPFIEAPGVGTSIEDIVPAILARPGVVSTPPAPMTISGFEGQVLDLHLAPTWSQGCEAPEGLIVNVPLLHVAGFTNGPLTAVSPNHPVRLILLDLTRGRTVAIVISKLEPTEPFEAKVAEVMPIIESFEFHPPAP